MSDRVSTGVEGGQPRVLLLAPYCYPVINAEAIVNAKLVTVLRAAGWGVEVLGEARETRRFYPGDDAGWESVREVVTPVAAASRLRSCAAFASMSMRGQPIITSGLGWTAAVVAEATRRLRAGRYDALISRAMPGYAHTAALAIRRRVGTPWIANWNDPLPLEKLPAPYAGGADAPWGAYQAWRYRSIARGADWHTFPCERQRRYVSRYLPEIAPRSSVVPHVALGDWAVPAPPRRDAFTLCHAGDLTGHRSPQVFLEGVRRFLQETPGCPLRLRFLLRNPAPMREALERAGLAEVGEVLEPQPYARMPVALADADVLVIIEAPTAEGIFFPSKLVDYAQTGRPILAVVPAVGTTRELVEAHGAGVAADVRSSEDVARAIGRLHRAWRAGTLAADHGSGRLREAHGPDRIETALRAAVEAASRSAGR